MRLVSATQTSFACPSQWDAFDEDGNYWYLRYRYGTGEARCYGKTKSFDELSDEQWRNPTQVLSFAHGHLLDGSITLDEFALRAGIGLTSELRETSFNQYLANQLAEKGAPDELVEYFNLPPAERETHNDEC